MSSHKRLQVDLIADPFIRSEKGRERKSDRWFITAKTKDSNSAPWVHYGNSSFTGSRSEARLKAFEIAADIGLAEGIDARLVDVVL